MRTMFAKHGTEPTLRVQIANKAWLRKVARCEESVCASPHLARSELGLVA